MVSSNVWVLSMILIMLSYNSIYYKTFIVICVSIIYFCHESIKNTFIAHSSHIHSLFALEQPTAISPQATCPEWLKFPDYERVVWLNHIVSILWNPDLKSSVEEIFSEFLEKIVDEEKPKFLNTLQFRELNLGKMAPVISSVKVFPTQRCASCIANYKHRIKHKEEPYCFIDFTLIFSDGDPSIVFGSRSTKQFIINNIQVKARFRFKICEYVNCLPGFSRVEISLLETPLFNYNLSAFHIQLSSFPMIKKWFSNFFNEDVFGELIFPKSFPYEFDFERINFLRATGQLRYYGLNASSRGVLKVKLKSVSIETPLSNESSVYCLIKIQKNKVHQTGYFQSKNPKKVFTFEEQILFFGVPDTALIDVFVYNECSNGMDLFIGQTCISVQKCNSAKIKNFRVPLKNSNVTIGAVDFSLHYIPPNSDSNEDVLFEKKWKYPTRKNSFSIQNGQNSIHTVIVTVSKLKGLRFYRNKTPDLHLFIEMGDLCVRRKIRSKSVNSTLLERFEFELPFLFTKTMTVSLFEVHSRFRKNFIGKAEIPFLDDDGILLDKRAPPCWYSIKSTSEDLTGEICLSVDSRIINLAFKKRYFNAKTLTKSHKFENAKMERVTAPPKTTCVMSIDILQARNLHLLSNSSSDTQENTFVTIQVNDSALKSTRIIENCSNPFWCEKFHFPINFVLVYLHVKVFSSQSKFGPSMISSLVIKVDDALEPINRQFWFPLAPVWMSNDIGTDEIELERSLSHSLSEVRPNDKESASDSEHDMMQRVSIVNGNTIPPEQKSRPKKVKNSKIREMMKKSITLLSRRKEGSSINKTLQANSQSSIDEESVKKRVTEDVLELSVNTKYENYLLNRDMYDDKELPKILIGISNLQKSSKTNEKKSKVKNLGVFKMEKKRGNSNTLKRVKIYVGKKTIFWSDEKSENENLKEIPSSCNFIRKNENELEIVKDGNFYMSLSGDKELVASLWKEIVRNKKAL